MFKSITGIEDWEGILSLDAKSIAHIAGKIKNKFWSEVLIAWSKLVKVYKFEEIQKILNFSLKDACYIKNHNLKQLQTHLMYAGCVTIADLYDESMNIISYDSFTTKYMDINFMDYASLIASLPRAWTRIFANLTEKPEIMEPDLQYKIITQPKTCRFAYKVFIDALVINKPHEQKWSIPFPMIEENEWKCYNKLPFQCTMNTKLQSFQYRIIHRILGTRKVLKLCNIVEDDLCLFCQNTAETITHLFVDCQVVKNLWASICDWLAPAIDLESKLNAKLIIFGDTGSLITSLILLISKYYIFLCRIRDRVPNLAGIKQMVKSEFVIEQQISKNNLKTRRRFEVRWKDLVEIVSP